MTMDINEFKDKKEREEAFQGAVVVELLEFELNSKEYSFN